jgi:phage FluMu gp28-like protein
MRQCKKFADVFNVARCVISHGEEYLKVPRLDDHGRPSAFTDEIKLGVIKFDNGSRILAFSAHPQAMAVYGGDVGLDEFAKHHNAPLLWETAQGRIAWGGDLAVWSAHDGEDTLFNEFALEARSSLGSYSSLSSHASRTTHHVPSPLPITHHVPPPIENRNSKFENPSFPWNLYFRVTLLDAIDLGLLSVINRTQNKNFTSEQFITDCRARARQEEIFQQAYMCNPLGASTNHIVDWSAIERCRYDYDIIRIHFEHSQIIQQFGDFHPDTEDARSDDISSFIHETFLPLFQGVPLGSSSSPSSEETRRPSLRLGFDVAASGQGDLAVFYIDEVKSDDLWLRALLTCRTEDWHFLETVLFKFLRDLRRLQAAGDASGLGRHICWNASNRCGGKFTPVNFASKKHDLGFALMNQLATAQKRFPQQHQDIAADFFALRKSFQSTRWLFSEGRNQLSPASHCDIAWAGALASHAHIEQYTCVRAYVG